SRRVTLVLRTRGVEQVPGLSAGHEDVVLRAEPARIVQARGRDPDPGRPLLRLRPGEPGAAVPAEAPLVQGARLLLASFRCSHCGAHFGGTRAEVFGLRLILPLRVLASLALFPCFDHGFAAQLDPPARRVDLEDDHLDVRAEGEYPLQVATLLDT